MLDNTDRALAFVKNVEQWDFEIYPTYPLSEEDAKAISDELTNYIAQKKLNECQARMARNEVR